MDTVSWIFKQEELAQTIAKSKDPESEQKFRAQLVSFIFAVCKEFEL